ncbi:adiponectin-like [Pristis pectinata]|uniref:adiponectin-like n=1 Tax=Pristis pectinata TaxID=685728 RepID=UPI00223E8C9C|nr:adiponectin-like [Pristis pectinata]
MGADDKEGKSEIMLGWGYVELEMEEVSWVSVNGVWDGGHLEQSLVTTVKMLFKRFLWLVVLVGLTYSDETDEQPEDTESEPEPEPEAVPESEPEPEPEPESPVDISCRNWMAGIPGSPGHNGIPGRDGRDGRDGAKGESGATGEPGPKGDEGVPGLPGLDGKEGLAGLPGDKGEKGDSGYSYRSAFSVGLTTRNPVPNMPIKFSKIFYNDQKHYNEDTGKFSCPYSGVYFFSYHITVYTKDVKVGLYKNNKVIIFTYDQFQSNDVDQAGGSVAVHLDEGDEVWLQVYGDNTFNGIYADNNNDSMFTGFLLYPDLH